MLVAVMAALIAGSSQAADASSAPPFEMSLACDVSLSVTRQIVEDRGDNIIFVEGGALNILERGLDAYHWSEVDARRRQGVQFSQPGELKFPENYPNVSAVEACEEMRSFLVERNIQILAMDELRNARGSAATRDATFVTVALAAPTVDKRNALVITGYSVARGGSGWVTIYSRSDIGEWVPTQVATAWIN